MEQPLISVIIPVYNVSGYLDRCMASVLGQTWSSLEIIMVDDGSTDDSGEKCDRYAEADSRVKVIHKTNGGLSDARNAGLDIATGQYMGYVDSDDYISLEMYGKMISAMERENADIAFTRYLQVKEGDDRLSVNGETGDVYRADPEALTRDRALNIYITDPDGYCIYNSVWSKLFKRELVEDMRFRVGQNSEDIVYTTEAICRAKKAVYLDTPLYYYVVDREGSIMNEDSEERMFRRMFHDEIPFWREHIEIIREHCPDEYGKMAAYCFYRRLMQYYMRLIKDAGDIRGTDDIHNNYLRRAALKIKEILLNERGMISGLLEEPFVSRGDRVRFRLFLLSPELYRSADDLYSSWRRG